MGMGILESAAAALEISSLTDAEIVKRVRAGDRALFEILMRRHNQRLYRAARAVVKDERDVEDVMQQAYINAFTHLHQFEERSQFSTWLTRIVLNEAFGRRQRLLVESKAMVALNGDESSGELMESITSPLAGPEHQAYARELRDVLEEAVDALPETYRTVFMLRDVEGLDTAETAACLDTPEATVKTRLHRARGLLRERLDAAFDLSADRVFAFAGHRCDRIVAAVLARIGDRSPSA